MVGELAKCMADPTRREECIEDILNRLLTQERTLSHALQVSFPEGISFANWQKISDGADDVRKARDSLRHLARDLGYKGYF